VNTQELRSQALPHSLAEASPLAVLCHSVPISGGLLLSAAGSDSAFPYSIIGSYHYYYGYNYRSLICSLKKLHLFHFALPFY
jgi:hypothetical protein